MTNKPSPVLWNMRLQQLSALVRRRISPNNIFNQLIKPMLRSSLPISRIERIYQNKSELLPVLDRPDIPLHTNGTENAIREYVKRRKISNRTRSETGRQCRDTCTNLKKTCRKLGLSFWQYLKDRIEANNLNPDLSGPIWRLNVGDGRRTGNWLANYIQKKYKNYNLIYTIIMK